MALAAYCVCSRASVLVLQVGNGANMKLVVNMMMGTMMTTLAEGLALTQKAGLQQKQMLEVLGLGAIAAPMYSMKVCYISFRFALCASAAVSAASRVCLSW